MQHFLINLTNRIKNWITITFCDESAIESYIDSKI